jgi:hypothetical protein
LHITAYIYVVVHAIRTRFQGDFLVRVVPRAEALGCFLFARRALGTRTRRCPNSSALQRQLSALLHFEAQQAKPMASASVQCVTSNKRRIKRREALRAIARMRSRRRRFRSSQNLFHNTLCDLPLGNTLLLTALEARF